MKLKKNILWNYWIEQFWPFEEISIFSNGGHLGYTPVLTDTILKGDHLRIISAKFGWDWLGELYKHIDELFNIYYGIFYELWTFTDFDWLCKLEKRGMKLKKNLFLWNYQANLNQTLLKWSLGGPLKNHVIYVKKLIIMLIQFKFGHFLA
jgi:hypothetical protein